MSIKDSRIGNSGRGDSLFPPKHASSEMTVNLLKLTQKNSIPEDTCATWLEHWEEEKGSVAKRCSICLSYVNHWSLVGALCQKMNKPDKTKYVIPVCKDCMREGTVAQSYEISDADLVSCKIEH